jgi:pimeloyl-ACP methyl ester carboxylesterase
MRAMLSAPAPVPAPASRSAAAALPEPRLVSLPSGATLATTDTGAGDPLVLIHGSLCDYRYWAPQIGALSQSWRVLSVSLSHYFPTRAENAGRPFSWRAQAAEVASFIDGYLGAPAHVVGHSRGGYVAFQLAVQSPGAVRSLTLADPGGAIHSGMAAGTSQQRDMRARAVALIAAGEVDAGLQVFVDGVSRPGTWAQSSGAFQTMARDNAHTLGPQLADVFEPMADADARQLAMPTLLIAGERSPPMFHRQIGWLAERIAGAQRVVIPGASHGMNLAHPRAFNQALSGFLSSI